MELLLPILIAAGLIVVAVLLVPRWRHDAGAAAVAVVSLLCLAEFAQELPDATKAMWDLRSTAAAGDQVQCIRGCVPFSEQSRQEAGLAIGRRYGVKPEFLGWVASKMSPGDTYYLVTPTSPKAAAFAQFITYRMLPHVAQHTEGQRGDGVVIPPSRDAMRKADWVVYYSIAEPRADELVPVEPARTFQPGFQLAKVRR